MQQIPPSYSHSKARELTAIAEAYIKLPDSTNAVPLLKQALTVAQQIPPFYNRGSVKPSALTAIAQAYIKLSDSTEEVNLLEEARTIAQQIDSSSSHDKARALTAIAEAYIKLSYRTEAINLLEETLIFAADIDQSSKNAIALGAIAQAQAKLERWGDALHTTKQCRSHECRVGSLSKVLTVYAELDNSELKEED